ncbi:FAD-dependent oxidoreductase [Candidatus Woesearchaeota archaeon]|nr:FAD-dependent oxidoreductase [Candidatus Woesearchaeota archaeon]
MHDIIIIGGGVSGFAAAMYAARLGLKVAVFAEMKGGTITWADKVENYPGFESISGQELANKIENHARKYSVEVIEKKVASVDKKENFIVSDGEQNHEAKAIILATGTVPRKLGLRSEAEYLGKGVHYCALCDAPFYKGKIVAVIGGSDTSVKEAAMLSEIAFKVYIIYRGESLRAEPVNLKMIEEKKNIEVITGNNVASFGGDKFLTKVILEKEYRGNKELIVDGVFVAAGHVPSSDLAKSMGVELNANGEIIIDREAKTNIEGVFAAGDVVDTKFKQAITGVAEGVTAAHSAYEWLKTK